MSIMIVLITLLTTFLFPHSAPAQQFHSFKSVKLPSLGNEAYSWDSNKGGPYTGLNDGRIVKYAGPKLGFQDFATTSPNRSKVLCDGSSGDLMTTGRTCGRPFGLEFNHKTSELYIADAFGGLMVVGPSGGPATTVLGDVHFDFADGIAIDPMSGDVYVSDLGTIFFKTNNMSRVLTSEDKAGKLVKYDVKTKRYTVIMTGLEIPTGVVVSRDGSFVLVAEYLNCRITRYWLKGPKTNTTEHFAQLPGNPDNIKRTRSGDFWVPVNIQRTYPEVIGVALGQKIAPNGRILETVNFYAEYNTTYVAEVQEYNGYLYVASGYTDFVGIYRNLRC